MKPERKIYLKGWGWCDISKKASAIEKVRLHKGHYKRHRDLDNFLKKNKVMLCWDCRELRVRVTLVNNFCFDCLKERRKEQKRALRLYKKTKRYPSY